MRGWFGHSFVFPLDFEHSGPASCDQGTASNKCIVHKPEVEQLRLHCSSFVHVGYQTWLLDAIIAIDPTMRDNYDDPH